MRIAFALAGLHRVQRGAEIAFEALAHELGKDASLDVTLFGSGQPRAGEPYAFVHVGSADRVRFEHWPRVPVLRNEYAWEELTFVARLAARYRPEDFDLTVTCGFPFTNWLLSRRTRRGRRPAHVFVTENGDHPAVSDQSEFRFFACDGLVCTNPEYFERNRDRWPCALIPNGVDPTMFSPGPAERASLGLPAGVPFALMVSALIASKRVDAGIRAAAPIEGLHLAVCGDGPERSALAALAGELMPGRFHVLSLARAQMPQAYRAADLLLHCSLDEPFGNVYLEALATGLPIVAHDRDVTRWILEDTSTLVDTRDTRALTQALREVLAQPHASGAGAGRALVARRYAWSSVAGAYAAFFQGVLERRARRA